MCSNLIYEQPVRLCADFGFQKNSIDNVQQLAGATRFNLWLTRRTSKAPKNLKILARSHSPAQRKTLIYLWNWIIVYLLNIGLDLNTELGFLMLNSDAGTLQNRLDDKNLMLKPVFEVTQRLACTLKVDYTIRCSIIWITQSTAA